MSEENKPIEADGNVQPLSHRRILIIMAIVVAVGSLTSLIFASGRFGLGFLIGGVLSFASYYWLKVSLKKVFDRIAFGENPRFLATRYVLRYAAFGAILAIVYLTEFVPVIAVILGVASFAVAITVEGLIRIFLSVFNKKEI